MLGGGVLALGASLAFALLGEGIAAPGMERELQVGLLLIGFAMLVRFPGQVYGAALIGAHRYDLWNLADAFTVLSFAAGAVLALELGWGIEGLAAAYAASLLLGTAAFALLLRRVDARLLAPPRLVRRETRRTVSSFAGITLLVDAMDFVAMRMDTIIVAAIRGAAAATPVAAAGRLVAGVQALILPFVYVLLPMIAELDAQGRAEEVRGRLLLATRTALQITLVAAGAIAIFAGDIVSVWLGPEAPDITATVVIVLMAVQVMILTATPATRVLLGLGRLRALKWLAIAEGVSNLALSVVLVILFGVVGAVVATLASSAVLVPVRVPLACRAAECPLGRLAREALLPALRGAGPPLALMAAILIVLDPGFGRLALGVGAGGALAVGIAAAQVGPGRLLRLGRQDRRYAQ
jgi:O-antigen/teichoic acid export membrane protein